MAVGGGRRGLLDRGARTGSGEVAIDELLLPAGGRLAEPPQLVLQLQHRALQQCRGLVVVLLLFRSDDRTSRFRFLFDLFLLLLVGLLLLVLLLVEIARLRSLPLRFTFFWYFSVASFSFVICDRNARRFYFVSIAVGCISFFTTRAAVVGFVLSSFCPLFLGLGLGLLPLVGCARALPRRTLGFLLFLVLLLRTLSPRCSLSASWLSWPSPS